MTRYPIPRRAHPLPALATTLGALMLIAMIVLTTPRGLPEPGPHTPPRPLSVLLASAGDLVTLTVELPVISTGRLTGYLGGVESVVIAAATARLGSDLTRATFTDINPRERTATLVLPLPGVTSVSIEPVHQQAGRYGLWAVLPFGCREADAAGQALSTARAQAMAAANEPHLITQASRHAGTVLTDLAATAGWTLTIEHPPPPPEVTPPQEATPVATPPPPGVTPE